jgi:putative ABC transport system permease protein
MSWLRLWAARLGGFIRGEHGDERLRAELDAHLEMLVAENERRGMSPTEAQQSARRQLGNTLRIGEEWREQGGLPWLESFFQDARHGFRLLRRNPAFAVIAILTLALGIGANTAIFSMVNGVLLRSLPYRQPSRLYSIHEVVPQWTDLAAELPVNSGNFRLWRKDCPAFSALALTGQESASLIGLGRPEFVHGAAVTSNFFSMLGVDAALGRTFSRERSAPGAENEVILSHRLWEEAFHSDPSVLGRIVNLSGQTKTVVGVLPASFRFPDILASTPEYFTLFPQAAWRFKPGIGDHDYFAIGRLRHGVAPRQAKTQLDVIEARIARSSSGGKFNLYATLTPLKTEIVGSTRRALWMLAIAAGLVLLIICVNLANLLLVKNTGRLREVAVRSAFGATPGRLARQFLTEALILALAGGGLGLVFAEGALRLLVRNAPVGIPRVDGIQIDLRVVLFAIAIAAVAGAICGLLPAMRLARSQPADALRTAGPTVSADKRAAGLRGALVVGEIALCAALLPGALLLVMSMRHVLRANEWMNQGHVTTARFVLPFHQHPNPQDRERVFAAIQRKVEELPGVESAGLTSKLPLDGFSWGDGISFREIPRPENETPQGEFRFVSPGYFQAIGLPLVEGRSFSLEDTSKPVAIISESVANKILTGRDPLGMHLVMPASGCCRVIGVVGNVRDRSDQAPSLVVYLPVWEYASTSETLVVRTRMDSATIAREIRQAVWSVDPELAIPQVRTLRTIMQSAEAPRRYETWLAVMFALFAVFFAAIGLYGVVSYSASQRTHEMGIRLALGAGRGDVLRLVMRQGLVLALAGVGIGVAMALVLTRFLSALLFGVSASDPVTFVAVSLFLAAVAVAASVVPAWRATRVDPTVALRWE